MIPPTETDSAALTLNQALLILHCRDLYPRDVVIRAAEWMVACRDAEYADVELACGLLGFGIQRGIR